MLMENRGHYVLSNVVSLLRFCGFNLLRGCRGLTQRRKGKV